ncbi:MAG: bifunctional metallophosphatase/5'-nucleotidase [Acidobacteria bacterium]|nr:bifunctional metallophosphatase/5'-nucleotidase [Acidobacteriota bacterium]
MTSQARLLRVVLAACLLMLAGGAQASPPAPVEITLLHVNDTHGYLMPALRKNVDEAVPTGGAGYLAGLIRQERDRAPERTLLLSAGDMFQGTPVSNSFQGKPVIEWMNHLGFDAMAVGNHEFDWGRDVLGRLRESAAFPFLAANIEAVGSRGPPLFPPSAVFERGGVRVAVIGVATPVTPHITRAENTRGLVFHEPADVLPPLVRKARRDGARLVVVLSHLGFEADRELARKVRDIDVIVGGHSHTAVREPLRVGRTLIAQAGSYGIYLGVLRLRVKPGGRGPVEVLPGSGLVTVLAGPDRPRDDVAAGMVDAYFERIKADFSRVVGSTTVDVDHDSRGETAAGNLVCDAMRESAKADLAIQNSGGIRNSLPRGDITKEQVFSLLPFDNRVVVLEMNGAQVRRLFEGIGLLERQPPQISGAVLEYRQRTDGKLELLDVRVGEARLDDTKRYRVATNDFLVESGRGYQVLGEVGSTQLDLVLWDVLLEYLGRHSPVSPRVEGRIVIRGPVSAKTAH